MDPWILILSILKPIRIRINNRLCLVFEYRVIWPWYVEQVPFKNYSLFASYRRYRTLCELRHPLQKYRIGHEEYSTEGFFSRLLKKGWIFILTLWPLVQEDWRYWVFTSIMGHFVHSFAQEVSNISPDDMERDALLWVQVSFKSLFRIQNTVASILLLVFEF